MIVFVLMTIFHQLFNYLTAGDLVSDNFIELFGKAGNL